MDHHRIVKWLQMHTTNTENGRYRSTGCFQIFNRWTLEVEAATDWEANCYYSHHMSGGNLLVAGRSYNGDIHLWNLKSNEKVLKIHIFYQPS